MKRIKLLLLLVLSFFTASSQLINRDGWSVWMGNMYLGHPRTGTVSAGNSNTWLQLGKDSTNRSMLLPRVVNNGVIGTPANGMFQYNLTNGKVYYYSGGMWRPVLDSISGSYTATNGLTLSGSQFKLGGILVDANTNIDGNGKNLYFDSLAYLRFYSNSAAISGINYRGWISTSPTSSIIRVDRVSGGSTNQVGASYHNNFMFSKGVNSPSFWVETDSTKVEMRYENPLNIPISRLRLESSKAYYTGTNFGIGTSTPNASALLDVTSTTQGAVLPRMNTTQMNAISSPVAGLMVYNSDSTSYCYYNGSAWLKMGSGAGGSYTAGNGLTLSGSQFKLGSPLTENTTITTTGYDFNLPGIPTVSSTTRRKVALIDTVTGKVEKIDVSTINSNIYNTDGTIPGQRVVTIPDGSELQFFLDVVGKFNVTNDAGDTIIYVLGNSGLYLPSVPTVSSTTGRKVALIDTATGKVERIDPATLVTNIYNSDGTLSGNRVLSSSNSYTLTFDSTHFIVRGRYGTGVSIPSYNNSQMFFNPNKAAFRAGLSSSQWNDANVGILSFATGNNTTASGQYSISLGKDNTSSGYNSVTIGELNTSNNDYSSSIGYSNISSGVRSSSIGSNLKSKHFSGTVIGYYNDSTNATSSTYNTANRVFQIGIGNADNARANAMTVLFSGNVGIGTTTPSKILHTVGTVRHASLGTASTDTTTYKPLGIDTNGDLIPMANWPQQKINLVFGGGSGADGDTTAFTTSAIYGSFYNDADTIVVTSFKAVLQGTSPDVTYKIWYNDSLNVEAGATALNTAGNQVTSTTTGTNVTSITNTKIPPGVWVWVKTSTVATKPKYFSLTVNGYRK